MADFNQPLPTQYPDLGVLFQNMPAIAAGQVGTQQRQADQNNQSLQDAFASQQAYNAQQRPLELQNLTANIGNTNAMAGLHNASARNTNLTSDIIEGTKATTIGAKNAANQTAISKADLDTMDQMGETFGQVAATTAGAPPMMRAQIAKRMLSKYIPEHPELENLLVTHADSLPQYFKDMSDNLYNASAKAKAANALSEREKEKITQMGENAARVANINAAGRIEAKKVGVKVPSTEAQFVGKMSFDKQVGYYNARAKEETDAGNEEAASNYKLEADKAYKAWQTGKILQGQQAQAGKVDVGAATGMKTQAAPIVKGFNNPTPSGQVPIITPEGKKGFIPAEQLDDALNSGYTKP